MGAHLEGPLQSNRRLLRSINNTVGPLMVVDLGDPSWPVAIANSVWLELLGEPLRCDAPPGCRGAWLPPLQAVWPFNPPQCGAHAHACSGAASQPTCAPCLAHNPSTCSALGAGESLWSEGTVKRRFWDVFEAVGESRGAVLKRADRSLDTGACFRVLVRHGLKNLHLQLRCACLGTPSLAGLSNPAPQQRGPCLAPVQRPGLPTAQGLPAAAATALPGALGCPAARPALQSCACPAHDWQDLMHVRGSMAR